MSWTQHQQRDRTEGMALKNDHFFIQIEKLFFISGMADQYIADERKCISSADFCPQFTEQLYCSENSHIFRFGWSIRRSKLDPLVFRCSPVFKISVSPSLCLRCLTHNIRHNTSQHNTHFTPIGHTIHSTQECFVRLSCHFYRQFSRICSIIENACLRHYFCPIDTRCEGELLSN